ncbi:MAG: hypothetical protein ACE5LF_10255 [Alphaproteobacteria bacterium]
MLPNLKFSGGEPSEDAIAIHRTAAALRIGEFDVFHLAHHNWFGHDADEKELEQVFVAYLFRRSVPHWVRHFCREALQGHVNVGPAAMGPRNPAEEIGQRFAAFAVAAALAGMLLLLVSGRGTIACIEGVPALDADGELTYTVPEDAGAPAC